MSLDPQTRSGGPEGKQEAMEQQEQDPVSESVAESAGPGSSSNSGATGRDVVLGQTGSEYPTP